MLIIAMISLLAEMTGFPVQGERIRNAVEEYVYSATGASRQELIIELRGRLPNLTASKSDYTIRVGTDRVIRLRGHVSIPVEIVANGTTETRTTVTVYIRSFGPVVIATHLLQHQALTADDVAVTQMETTTLPEDRISEPTVVAGKRTARLVSGNSVLCRAMVEAIPVIKEGDAVTIVVSMRHAVVKVRGNARQDGCIGDMIAVQRDGSHERFQGKVISEHVVELALNGPPSFLR
jgi:flagella basal body P-ring formation protein FlgA